MKNKKRVWWIVFLSVFFLAGTICYLNGEAIAGKGGVLDRKPIGTIGIFEIADFTGPTADGCMPPHNALYDIFRHTNENGGIIYI